MPEPYRPMGDSSPPRDTSPREEGSAKPPMPWGDPTLLESVLRRTLLQGGAEEGDAGAQDQAALREVASRHCGRNLAEPPVLIELVEAALKPQLPPASNHTELLRSLSGPIAESLREDPFAWRQLQLLWARLCEVVP